jgi:hypothetical protein
MEYLDPVLFTELFVTQINAVFSVGTVTDNDN